MHSRLFDVSIVSSSVGVLSVVLSEAQQMSEEGASGGPGIF